MDFPSESDKIKPIQHRFETPATTAFPLNFR